MGIKVRGVRFDCYKGLMKKSVFPPFRSLGKYELKIERSGVLALSNEDMDNSNSGDPTESRC